MNYREALQCIKAMTHFDGHRRGCQECIVGVDGDVEVCEGFNSDVDRYNVALRATMKEAVASGLLVDQWELSECRNSLRRRVGNQEISLTVRWVDVGFDWLWWIWDHRYPQERQVIDTGMTNPGPDPLELLPHAMSLAEVLSQDPRVYNCPHRNDDVVHDDECLWCRWRVSEQRQDGHDEDCSWLRLAYRRSTCEFDAVTGNHL